MRLPQSTASFFGSSIHIMVNAVVATACSCIVVLSTLAQAATQAEDDIFHSTNLLRISIEITEDGVQALRPSRAGLNSQPKPKAQATVTEGGRVYTNVTVQLKGFTTFQSIDGLPSLTLNFDHLAPKQRFHGLTKISLNNSLQDATRLHEKFSRELFAAADVPVPRADYALVALNGRELGLYVLTEGFDKEFLKRHFKRTDGNLYEGGTLKDIDQPLHLSPGKNPTNQAGVQRLIRASREPDPHKRWRALEAALDMDRFLSMMAMETILCHSDSYSMNRNNYRLYHDPTTDKIVFMPHGMDRVLGTHRSSIDLPIVTPALGLVARGVLSTPEGRERYSERAVFLFTNLFQPDRLCRRVRELDAKIFSAKNNRPADGRFDGQRSRDHTQDAEDLCSRISARAAELKVQMTELPALLAPAPIAAFDSNGVARIDGWKPKRSIAQSKLSYEAKADAEKLTLHLRSAKGSLTVSLYTKVSLPVGSYRLTGQIIKANPAGITNSVLTTMLRYSASRFAIERQRLNSRELNFFFQVLEVRAPEEIEFICDLRDNSSEVWFDASSLRLVREHR